MVTMMVQGDCTCRHLHLSVDTRKFGVCKMLSEIGSCLRNALSETTRPYLARQFRLVGSWFQATLNTLQYMSTFWLSFFRKSVASPGSIRVGIKLSDLSRRNLSR